MSFNSQQLVDKAKRYQALLSCLPWVEAILVTGSVAKGQATSASDIDLVALVRPNRIYLTKAWYLFVFSLLNIKENSVSKSGKFSLGTVISTKFSAWQIKLSPLLDYTSENINVMIPVYGEEKWYQTLGLEPLFSQQAIGVDQGGVISDNNSSWFWSNTGSKVLGWIDQFVFSLHKYKTFAQARNITIKSFTVVERDLLSLHAVSAVLDKIERE